MTAVVQERHYHVYILSSRSRAIYIGVTGDLPGRIESHRAGDIAGHTRRYRINRLVYFEGTTDIAAAIAREKQLKGWRRRKKVQLIESGNPTWKIWPISCSRSRPFAIDLDCRKAGPSLRSG